MKTLLPEINSADKRFHAGNPATGEQGTRVTDMWLNDVQDRVRDVQAEAHYVLEKAGFIPVENKQTQLYEAIVKIIDDNRKKTSTTQKGEVQLTSDTGLDSEELGLTAKAGKVLAQGIAALRLAMNNYIPLKSRSSSVTSNDENGVATPKAVKTAYDKGVEAQTAADKAQTAADKAQRTAEVKAPVANPIFTTDKTYMDMDTIPSGTLFFRINERAANQPDNTYGYFDAQAWQFDVGDQKTQFIIYNDSDMKVRYKDDGQRWTSWNTMLTSKNLSDSVTNSARDIPASVGGVKIAYDRAVEAEKKGLPTGAVLGFAKGVTPTGFLKCDGTIFNRHTYPDLYRALGNKNTLPNLQRSDVGMLAYFPHDNIPAGWLPCDGESVTQAQYPELYRYLGNKYGANGKLPEAGNRFIRNAGAGLAVGTLQNDAIKTHEIQVPDSSTLGRNAGVFHYAERGGAHNSEYNILTYKGEEETRPKAIAFKLCIKAKNTFDDVIFWIKAFGEVQNAGVLDAGRIAQDLQDKADRRHTHTASQITDFSAATHRVINSAFTYQKIGGFEVRKYADGTMIQTCLHRRGSTEYNRNYNDYQDFVTLVYPVAFIEMPTVNVMPQLSHPYFDDSKNGLATNDKTKRLGSGVQEANDGSVGLTIDNNNKQCQFNYQNSKVFISEMTFHITAIGRWK
ncbi:phage tail protein [Actinobacillus seminis]|uniref:Phage Tail Collar Domain n=1 Tax=Actinobacillus seminis TaxID=722 RepID=A0A263HBR7_9PAST|nr:tail fiber protein [Actinobacillus seminis]OZN24452.1 phage tail protein [Actinobacillus seminis]SUU37514.1 Phage Tail Collar Domain [Actinobacillus seminis]